MPRLPHRPLLLAICLALPLAACSDDPADTASADDTIVTTTTAEPDSTTGSTTATTAERDLTPEQEVEAAYLAAFEVYFTAGESPSEPHRLAEHFADAALVAVERNIDRLRLEGLRSDFPSGHPAIEIDAVAISPEANTAVVSACVVDTGQKIVIADGRPTDTLPTSRSVTADLALTDTAWMVVAHRTMQEWNDDLGCER